MDDDQQFCLRWNNHQSTLISVFDTLLEKGIHVDCTLAAEGQTLKAHKVVLSACSPYFESVLSQQYDKHPIIILKDVKFAELRAMMDYMYRGEVNISQDQLGALLKAAESLQIKGLSDSKPPPPPSHPSHPRTVTPPPKVGTIRTSPGGDIDEGSREGSISPSRRKRKKRRTSLSPLPPHPIVHAVPTSPAPLNHSAALPLSNHSSQPTLNNSTQVTLAATVVIPPSAPVVPPADAISEENDTMAKIKRIQFNNEPVIKAKIDTEVDIPAVVRPKAEYSDDGIEDSVEDLTLDEEADSDGDMEHSGYPWPLERSQDESITGQDGHRDSQESRVTRSSTKQTKAKEDYGVMDLDSDTFLGVNFDPKPTDSAAKSNTPSDIKMKKKDSDIIKQPVAAEVKGNQIEDSKVFEDDIKKEDTICKSESPNESAIRRNVALPCAEYATPKGFKCPHCQRTYNARKNLVRHVNLECGREPQYKCPHCSHGNHRRNELKRHIQKKHSDKAPLSDLDN